MLSLVSFRVHWQFVGAVNSSSGGARAAREEIRSKSTAFELSGSSLQSLSRLTTKLQLYSQPSLLLRPSSLLGYRRRSPPPFSHRVSPLLAKQAMSSALEVEARPPTVYVDPFVLVASSASAVSARLCTHPRSSPVAFLARLRLTQLGDTQWTPFAFGYKPIQERSSRH